MIICLFYFTLILALLYFQRLFTAEELALHNGTDESIPILLGILGYSSLFLCLFNSVGDVDLLF